jgi:UDP-N-acetyl-D-galactosamine dehydrogenase
MGYEPEVLLAGRRINDGMGAYVAEKLIKMLIDADIKLKGARVGILGLASKANCDEARNTRVPDICRDLREYGIEAMVHDPLVAPQAASRQTGIRLTALAEMMRLDALVLAVSHQDYVGLGPALLEGRLRDGGVLVDLTSVIDPASVPPGIRYWSL